MAYLKKNRCKHVESINPRLLEPEDIEILDGACKPKTVSVTRYEIEHKVTALLKKGLTSTSVGGFFFIPYLLQLNFFDSIDTMCQCQQFKAKSRPIRHLFDTEC